jgi:hypothetical protein
LWPFAWWLMRHRRWRIWLTAPFAISAALGLAWLPLEYGKLVLPNEFSRVQLGFAAPKGATSHLDGTLYLLNWTDSDFVLWAARQRKIIWVPVHVVASAEISASRPLSEILKSPETAGQ